MKIPTHVNRHVVTLASSLIVVFAAMGCQAPMAVRGFQAVTFQLNPIADGGAVAVTPAARPADGAATGTGPATEPVATGQRPGGPTGGGGASSGAPFEGRVLDRQGQPVAGATVLSADGGTAVTDAAGGFAMSAAQAALPTVVAAAGYATSMVAGGALPAVLHLGRLAPPDAGFEASGYTVRGTVSWPEAPYKGGTVQYRDDLGSVSLPVVVNDDGFFALRVETRRPGRPRGVIMALAAGADGHARLGLSAPFSLVDQADAPVNVPIAVADQAVDFAVGPVPAGLGDVKSGVEYAVPGVPPFWLALGEGRSGRVRVPAPGAVAATVRVAVEAGNEEARSVVTIDPYHPPATPPAFLAVPSLTVAPGDRRVAWGLPAGAAAALLQLAVSDEPRWEGWFEGVDSHIVAAAQWPAGGPATARLVAFDGPQAAVRHVAAIRALRLLPAEDWAGGYRLAERRVSFLSGGSGS